MLLFLFGNGKPNRMLRLVRCAKRKLGASPTDRELLLCLNRLCAFFCVIQIAAGVGLVVVRTAHYSSAEDAQRAESNPDRDKPLFSLDLWSLELFVLFLSLINLVLLYASMLAQRAIRDVNLVGSSEFCRVIFYSYFCSNQGCLALF